MFRPPTRIAACLGSTLLSSRSILYSIFLHHKIPPVGISCGNTPRCMMYTHRRWLFPALAPESIKYLHCKMEDVVFLLKRGSNRKKKSPGCSCAFIDHRTHSRSSSRQVLSTSLWPARQDSLGHHQLTNYQTAPRVLPAAYSLFPSRDLTPPVQAEQGAMRPVPQRWSWFEWCCWGQEGSARCVFMAQG